MGKQGCFLERAPIQRMINAGRCKYIYASAVLNILTRLKQDSTSPDETCSFPGLNDLASNVHSHVSATCWEICSLFVDLSQAKTSGPVFHRSKCDIKADVRNAGFGR